MGEVSWGSVVGALDYLGVTVFLPTTEDPRTGKRLSVGHREVGEIVSHALFGMGPDCLVALGFGSRSYAEMFSGPIEGFRWHRSPKTGGGHCHFELKGEACATLGYARVRAFLVALTDAGYHWRCSRVDAAFDGVPFRPVDVREAWLDGRVVTRIHRDSHDWRENAEGTTFYYGRRASGRLVRVYDRRGPTRIEVEAREDRARLLGDCIASLEEADWLGIAAAELGSAARFLDASGAIAEWWRSVIVLSDLAQPIRVSRRQPSLSAAAAVVSQARDQLRKLLAKAAVLAAGLGWDAAAVASQVQAFDLSAPDVAGEVQRLRLAVSAAYG